MSKRSSMYRDSRWQQKRLEIMERDNWTCQSCGARGEGVTLNVHHAYYEKGKRPWEYDNSLLITWCEECHEKRHYDQQKLLTWYMNMPKCQADNVRWFIEFGWDAILYEVNPEVPIDTILCMMRKMHDLVQDARYGDDGGRDNE